MKKATTALLGLLAALAMLAQPAAADTLGHILSTHTLVAGVKTDYPPWGMRDSNGNIVGMEIDMVRDFAKRLGEQHHETIKVKLVPVVASNRMQFLAQGKIDVMIATMSDTPPRRKVVGIVYPDYYSSGVAVFARKDSGIDSWKSISGKRICGIQGAWYNRDLGAKNGAQMVNFTGVPEVQEALLSGRCAGFLYDDSFFVGMKVREPKKWADFHLATPVVRSVPWGAAVRLDDLHGRLGKALSAAIIAWHKDGTLLALQKKWGIPPTRWLQQMHEACLKGEPVCSPNRPKG